MVDSLSLPYVIDLLGKFLLAVLLGDITSRDIEYYSHRRLQNLHRLLAPVLALVHRPVS